MNLDLIINLTLYFTCLFGAIVIKYSCSDYCKQVVRELRRNGIMVSGTLVFLVSGNMLSIYRKDDPSAVTALIICSVVIFLMVLGFAIHNLVTAKNLTLPE